MPDYSYQAADDRGRVIAGSIAAAGRPEALQALRAQGLHPLRLAESPASSTEAPRYSRAADALPFTQQLATLLQAGLQLDRALGIMADLGRGDRLGATAAAIRRDLQEGASFSAALSRHPRLFGRVYVNMAQAGETGGLLPLVMQRLAASIEEERDLRSFILGALLYPAVVAAVSILAVVVLMVWVVPRFEQIFTRLGQELPAITRLTIGASRAVAAYGPWAALAVAALLVYAWSYLRTPAGRARFDRLRLRAPFFGDLYLKLVTAGIARTMAMLTGAGVPVLQSLAVVKETVENSIISAALARAGQEIKEGGSIARRLEAQGVLPPLAIGMIAVGEETGELPKMFEQVARGYDAEARRTIRNLLALLEPALILCLTAVTLLIAMSILIPLIRMSAGM